MNEAGALDGDTILALLLGAAALAMLIGAVLAWRARNIVLSGLLFLGAAPLAFLAYFFAAFEIRLF